MANTTGKEAREMLEKALKGVRVSELKALEESAMAIQAESMQRTPIEFGSLRRSAFTDSGWTRSGAQAVAGYTAKYAAWVHEMVKESLRGIKRTGKKAIGRYWDGGRSKFLESAGDDLKPQILRFIKKRLKR